MAKRSHDIAVVGYAAILPGADSAEKAWEVLESGTCTVSEVPQDRWSSVRFLEPELNLPGRTYTRRAGVLDDVWSFDPAYFSISPREAEQMDTQQRILLQTVARAFDHAGIDPSRIDNEKTGVFIGASSSDHSTIAMEDLGLIDAQYMLGNTLSVIANRIAYQWNLRGPSYTVDTACSSALFALDQARRAIVDGTVTTAVVGGVNMLTSPLPFVGFSKAGMLSPDGLCKAFSADAKGYVRGEGAVVFVLQRADVARKAKRRIRSIFVGSATNTSGRTSGIALPSMSRQRALIEQVIKDYAVDPANVAFVEAHGTGTRVGDPREAEALGHTYGKGRSEPLPIGSAKSNFGHLEPVAGLVGLLKAQLALENGTVPATLHVDELNPDIDFEGLNVQVAQTAIPIPERKAPWFAAVNSFGFGGANAHAVIRQPDPGDRPAPATAVALPPSILISAASEAALKRQAEAWQGMAREAAPELGAAIRTANHHISRHRHRLCLAAGSPAALDSQIAAWLDGGNASKPGASAASDLREAPVAFLFSGNGALWDGMARHIFMRDAVFRESFRGLSELFVDEGWPDLTELLMAPDLEEHLGEARVATLLFAIQIALCDALKAQGVVPTATAGHSVGEVAAAVVAGRISRETGVRIVCTRSIAFEPLYQKGGMAALAASVEETEALIADAGLRVDVAADNAPKSVTVSGDVEELTQLMKAARKRRIAGRVLKVDYPYHSAAVDVLKERLLDDLKGVTGRKSSIAFYSSCYGARHDDGTLGPDYWWDNARNAVRFREALTAMAEDGNRVFVEISPKTILRSYMRATLDEVAAETVVLESLDTQRSEQRDAASIARSVLAAGGRVDEDVLLGQSGPVGGRLPSYSFDKETFRLGNDAGIDIFGRRSHHAFLGARLDPKAWVWGGGITLSRAPWLGDHKVGGRVLFPATAILELMLTAAKQGLGTETVDLRDLEILRPIELLPDAETRTRVTYEPTNRRLTLEAGAGDSLGIVAVASVFSGSAPDSVATIQDEGTEADTAGIYDRLRAAGLDYGAEFARLRDVSVDGPVALAQIDSEGAREGFLFDPALADSALHAAFTFIGTAGDTTPQAYVPTRIGRARLYATGTVTNARLHARGGSRESVEIDVEFLDADGASLVRLEGLRLRPMPLGQDMTGGFWIETQVPTAGQLTPALAGAARRLTREAEAEPTDFDVLRSAIAGRLAWDLVAAGPGEDTPEARYEIAAGWLVDAGHAELTEAGKIELKGTCPWPDADTLLALLPNVAPDADAELHAMLGALTGSRAERRPSQRLPRLARSLLDGLDARSAGRLLLVGNVDDALVRAARRVAAHVSIAAFDEDGLARFRSRLNDLAGIRLLTLDQAAQSGGYDLMIGAGVTQALSASDRKAMPELVVPGGSVAFAEEAPDLFALLTGRQRTENALTRLKTEFKARQTPLESRTALDSDGVVILTGQRDDTSKPGVPPLSVIGTTALAEALAALEGDEDLPALLVRVIATAPGEEGSLARAAAFRDLPSDASTVWIVEEDIENTAELAGWRRALQNETGRDIRTLSVAPGTDAAAIAALIGSTAEVELVLDENGVRTPRVSVWRKPGKEPTGKTARLVTTHRSLALDGLTWAPVPEEDLGDDMVEIEVVATGLNFRDVMWAQGLIPPEALENGFAGQCVGMECSGRISRAGPASGFAAGQEVIAFAPHAFASHVRVPAASVLPAPAGLDLRAAASVPVIFLTADYALNELARLSKGETILIHGGAGGVGIAAIQIADAVGATVIATAGSPEKRRFLKSMGVEHIADSRSLSFEDDVRRITGGRGVDVVLNSLAGEAMERSLACLASFGRFIELGKRDFFENSAIGLRAMRNNISYFAVDADQLLGSRPDAAQRSIERVIDGFTREIYSAPPVTIYPAEDVEAAFHLMKGSGHIGKIVVEAPVLGAAASDKPAPIRGRWLITGGTRGFGLETAKWLAAQGATDLWLVSRGGQIDEAAKAALEAQCAVTVRAVDIAEGEAVEALITEATADGTPLSGVVHGAMVLDDAYFKDLDDARIANVMAAKLTGARHLDAATRGLALDHFWLYSSVAARFGNPGQAPYVAANRALEALAEKRRAEGLPGLAVAWGPIADAGYLTEAEATRTALEERLGKLLPAREALNRLASALTSPNLGAAITIAPMQWGRLKGDLPVVAGPIFEQIDMSGGGMAEADIDIRALIQSEGVEKAKKIVIDMLVEEAARIMRAAPSEIDPKRPLATMGFDSLMGMSLKIAVEERLGTSMPVASIGDDLSLAGLVQRIFDSLDADAPDDVSSEMERRHLAGLEVSDETREKVARSIAEGEDVRREA